MRLFVVAGRPEVAPCRCAPLLRPCSRRPSAISLCSIAPSTFTLNLPTRVSLEPSVSTCAYGLTASNSFVFAWNDACVEREATNRVDAAIELFASGDAQVRFGDSATNIVARPPEGFVGIGQDTNWAAAAFSPTDFAAITNKGYEAWLMEDYIGYNEPNGRYKVDVLIAALPDHGPCYLVSVRTRWS